MNPRYAPMFAPYTLNNGVAIKNRFVVAPLTIYESDANGGLTDAARNFWRDRFRGFGLFVMPFTNVHPTGIGFPSPNAFDASHLPTLREYAAFVNNHIQIKYVGTRFVDWAEGQKYGNYWSDNSAFDLDGDGIADTAYKPNGITDQILWRAPAARLLMNSPAVTIVKWAQKNFPAIMPGGMTDSKPLMVMPETETLKKLRELKAGAQKTG